MLLIEQSQRFLYFMNFKFHIFSSILLLTTFVSCKKGTEPTAKKASVVDIYAVGVVAANSSTVATFWKNGVATKLSDNLGSSGPSITVNGSDIYITVSTASGFTIWKNGIVDDAANSYFKAISNTSTINNVAIFGNDVYFAGYINSRAAYWKNGVPTMLSDGAVPARALGISVSGTNIGVLGQLGNNTVYWKNGTLTTLPLQNIASEANDITMAGNDLYLSCASYDRNNNRAVTLWQNGTITQTEAENSYPNGVLINGADKYVFGDYTSLYPDVVKTFACYWKNGVITKLTTGSTAEDAFALSINGNDVYVAGVNSLGAVYWKNGQAVQLDQSGNSFLSGIAVVSH